MKFLSFLRASMLWLLILPYVFMYVGAASNQLVLIANHDKFPVMVNQLKLAEFEKAEADAGVQLPDGMLDEIHCVMTDRTHLNFLADIFDFHGEGIESVGDLLLDFGAKFEGILPLIWGALMLYRVKEQE